MNTIIHTYKEVYISQIKLYTDGSCRKYNTYVYHIRDVINKMACVNVDNNWDLVSDLSEETSNTSFSPGSSLYVASECKTGRDTFRNSGYSITRSPDKADAIVVPDVRADFYHKMTCNMIAYDEKNDFLYLVGIDKPGYLVSQLTDNDLANVSTFLKNEGLTPDEIQRENITVWFVPKCDELIDVMKGQGYNKPYIQESKVPLKTSTTISPETLVFWENIEDMNLLVRTICTSDWAKYPITTLAFLACCKDHGNLYNYANNDFRRILKAIGYEGYGNREYWGWNNRYISPEDYDMLQAYLYYKLGLEEKGGLVSAKKFEAIIPSYLRPFLKRANVLKPMPIPAAMKLSNISSLAES